MNRIELGKKMEELGIRSSIYSLYGPSGVNKTVLEWGIKWKVYDIDDRGGIDYEQYFDTEDEACEYLYERMLRFKEMEDEIARRPPYVRPAEEEKRIFIASADGDIRVEKEEGETETVNDKQ